MEHDTGEQLARLRTLYGFTQAVLAREMGTSQPRISEVERRAFVRPVLASKYRKALDRLYGRQVRAE